MKKLLFVLVLVFTLVFCSCGHNTIIGSLSDRLIRGPIVAFGIAPLDNNVKLNKEHVVLKQSNDSTESYIFGFADASMYYEIENEQPCSFILPYAYVAEPLYETNDSIDSNNSLIITIDGKAVCYDRNRIESTYTDIPALENNSFGKSINIWYDDDWLNYNAETIYDQMLKCYDLMCNYKSEYLETIESMSSDTSQSYLRGAPVEIITFDIQSTGKHIVEVSRRIRVGNHTDSFIAQWSSSPENCWKSIDERTVKAVTNSDTVREYKYNIAFLDMCID